MGDERETSYNGERAKAKAGSRVRAKKSERALAKARTMCRDVLRNDGPPDSH